MKGRRVLPVDSFLLLQMLRQGVPAATPLDPVPPDTQLVDAKVDPRSGRLNVLLESVELNGGSTFDDSPRLFLRFQRLQEGGVR